MVHGEARRSAPIGANDRLRRPNINRAPKDPGRLQCYPAPRRPFSEAGQEPPSSVKTYNVWVPEWFPEPEERDDTFARPGEGTLSWLARSTLPRAAGYRAFLNRNLTMLPADCREGIYKHLRAERHHQDGLFELVVGRTLQEMDAEIECEPEGLPSGKRPDFVARFPDGTVFVEAVSPVLDRELGVAAGGEAPIAKLVEESVPPGWAANITSLPRVRPDEPRRHIKAYLRREMDIPPPVRDDEEVEIRQTFDQGDLSVILFPQSRHGLSADTKIALHNAIAYFPNDEDALRGAVKRKYEQLRNLDRPTLVALNMSSTTSSREDLDQALFGVTVSQRDREGDEVGRYFRAGGLFAGGVGRPTISGVLAFPEVGILRCADPALWVHPRFEEEFPQALNNLEIRNAPQAEAEVIVHPAKKTEVLRNLGFVEGR